jgi:hypothetical protein
VLLFACGGIDLAAARHGRPPADGILPWLCRRLGGIATPRGRPDCE